MHLFKRTALWALAGNLLLAAGVALATNEGQEELDKATRAKLNAKTLSDLSEVIRLCDSALSKGLDDENTKYAKSLLASTLSQRGIETSKSIFDGFPPDPGWPQFRRVALEDLEKSVKLDPAQPETLVRIAQLNLLPEGNLKRAGEALDQAIRYSKQDAAIQAQALTLRANMEKDPAKKLARLNEAVRVAADDVVALRSRGAIQAQMGKLAESLADFNAALKLEPKHSPTLDAKAIVLAKMKKFDEALATVDAVAKLEPKSIVPLLMRAEIHTMKPDLAAALKDLNEASHREPGNIKVLLLRAFVYQQMNEKEKALADVDKALELNPKAENAMRFRALLLVGEGKYHDAIEQVEELLKEDPADVDVQLQLALLYSAEQKFDKAIAICDKLIAKDPGNAGIKLQLALLHGANQNHEKSVEICSELVAKDPANWKALLGRADALLGLGKHVEAVADYEKAFKLHPGDSAMLNNFAWVLSTSPMDNVRNGKRALELAKEACKLTDYKQAHILSTLGAAYAELGDFKTAMQWSQKAIELGKDEQKEDLKKELISYKAGKPIRELKAPQRSEKPAKKTPPTKPAEPKKKPADKAKPTEKPKATDKPKPETKDPSSPK